MLDASWGDHPQGWHSLMVQDIKCPHYHSGRKAPLPPADDPDAWANLVRSSPNDFRGYTVSAIGHSELFFMDRAHLALRQKELENIAAGSPLDQPRSRAGSFVCYECGHIAPDMQQLRAHVGKYHKTKNATTFLASSSRCQVCKRDFGIKSRLVKHLGNAPFMQTGLD